ncbi:unnamed protein product [Meloidogyne enterolobii]|uniref:Uncharacterized protein n=1 Tax=Meloidogyne enterolobii TaxID=390850 RepID=A0ACB0YXR6_MELEN
MSNSFQRKIITFSLSYLEVKTECTVPAYSFNDSVNNATFNWAVVGAAVGLLFGGFKGAIIGSVIGAAVGIILGAIVYVCHSIDKVCVAVINTSEDVSRTLVDVSMACKSAENVCNAIQSPYKTISGGIQSSVSNAWKTFKGWFGC